MANNRNSECSRYSNSNNKDINLSLIEANLSNSVISEEDCDNGVNDKRILTDVGKIRDEGEHDLRPPLVNFTLHNPSKTSWFPKQEDCSDSELNMKVRSSIQKNGPTAGGNLYNLSKNIAGNITSLPKNSNFAMNPPSNKYPDFTQAQQRIARSSSNQRERLRANYEKGNTGDLYQHLNQTELLAYGRENGKDNKGQDSKKMDLKLDLSFLNKNVHTNNPQNYLQQKVRFKKDLCNNGSSSSTITSQEQRDNNVISTNSKSPISKLEKKIAEALMNRDQVSNSTRQFSVAEEQLMSKREKSPIEGSSTRRQNEDLEVNNLKFNQNLIKKRNKELSDETSELRKKLSSAEKELEKFKTMKEEVIRLREQNEEFNKKIGKLEEKWVSKRAEMEEITRINQEQHDLLFHFITSNFDPNLDSNDWSFQDLITYIAEKFLEVLNDEQSIDNHEIYWKEIALDYMKKSEILQMNICDLESRLNFTMSDKIKGLQQQLQAANYNYEQLLVKYQKQSSIIKYNYPQTRLIQNNNNRGSKEALTDRNYGQDRINSNKKRDTDWESHSTERESMVELNETNQSYGNMIRATRKNMNIREQNFSFFSQSPMNSRIHGENDPHMANKKKPPKPGNTEDGNDTLFQSQEEGRQMKKINVVVDKKVGKYIEKLKQKLKNMENELSFFREKSITERDFTAGDSVEFDTSHNMEHSATHRNFSSKNYQNSVSNMDSNNERGSSYKNHIPSGYGNHNMDNLKSKSFR